MATVSSSVFENNHLSVLFSNNFVQSEKNQQAKKAKKQKT